MARQARKTVAAAVGKRLRGEVEGGGKRGGADARVRRAVGQGASDVVNQKSARRNSLSLGFSSIEHENNSVDDENILIFLK